MVDVSSQSNKVNITVSSSGVSSNVNASGDTTLYYSNKAREWAISNRIVDGVDYSSKYYANKANESATKAEKVVEDVKSEAQTQISAIQQVSQLEQEEIQEIINRIEDGKAVYIGEDEPTDPIYTVWVSPEDNNVDLEIQEIKEKLDKNDVDIDNIATDLNGKADTDLTNVTDQGKILMSSMGMPSSKRIDLTLGASGASYTAPADGWFFMRAQMNNTYAFIEFDNRTSGLVFTNGINSGAPNLGSIAPCKKDDVMRVYYTGLNTSYTPTFRFHYAVGSESEAE